MMNMAEDIHGNNILKEYMSIVNRRNSHVNGYMISIQFSKIVDHVCKMYHVLKGRQKYRLEIIIFIGGQASQQKIILRIVNEPASHQNYTQ